ncbi:hypothetical protein [Paenibacillus campinasensis]|uniref:AAA family ATPase n=1 Tax=Paenibacillus campinasensis TaxID=66347 RepID=A0A268EE01_9BACL|nr:hypothetical protein [Paenibacillus campinasensis]PAD71342.1 hypothetical protein CHH67_24670 [Paenibacillus campinasensis]
MAQVAFWGFQHGLGVTSNTAAMSALIGTEYQIRTLSSQPQWGDTSLERSFQKSLKQNTELYDLSGFGMDAIERAVRAGKLQNETVKNNSIFIERDRLDLLLNSRKASRSQFEAGAEVFKIVYDRAKAYYDVVLLDLHSGTNSEVTNALIETSDLVVVCINQNIHVIEKFFGDKESWPSALKDRPHVLMVGQYDLHSKYKLKNIANKYGYKAPILSIPYNTNFKDHYNDGDLKGFITRNRYINKNHDNYIFMQELRRAAEHILTEIGVNTQIKSIQKGVS